MFEAVLAKQKSSIHCTCTFFVVIEPEQPFQVESTIGELLEKKKPTNQRASNNKMSGLFSMHTRPPRCLKKKNIKISTVMHHLD